MSDQRLVISPLADSLSFICVRDLHPYLVINCFCVTPSCFTETSVRKDVIFPFTALIKTRTLA